MKIIVSNESEKLLVRKFIEQIIDDDVLTQFVQDTEQERRRCYEEDTLDYTDAIFLENAFLNANINVGETSTINVDYDSVLDTCSVCEQEMCINMDFNRVDYEEYLNHDYGNSMCNVCSEKE